MDIFPNLIAAVASQVELVKKFHDGKITREQIVESVQTVLETIPEQYRNDSSLYLRLIERAEKDNKTWMGNAHTISTDDGHWKPWLEKAKPEIEWRYWDRYAHLLLKEDWSPNVVRQLGETTDETLSQLNNPQSGGEWDRRGMVVGSVQSGKTANYTGLICKAADAGYKVIIVLAGFHNNLRSQTQIRLEEGFIGYYKDKLNSRLLTGVGKIAHDGKLSPNTITTRADNGDFNKAVATNFSSSIDRPLIFVIKKNASVLRNVLEYLKGQAAAHKGTYKDARISSEYPLLLVDDESDQGSINTNKTNIVNPPKENDDEFSEETDPTVINGLIRKIIKIFEQSAYVAYTATPFANIMIHKDAGSKGYGDDLFPRSFIISTSAPSNYIGPQTVFGYTNQHTGEIKEGLPLTRDVSDYAATKMLIETKGWMPPRHKKTHVPLYDGEYQLPPSLYKAILSFLLACSVRTLRGQGNKHCSMLVHVTRFIDVQHHVMEQVKATITTVRQCLVSGFGDPSFTIWDDLENLWDKDFHLTNEAVNDQDCPIHNWHTVREILPKIVQTIKIREINGTAGDVLDYEAHKEQGLNVIAIGGDKLSRGLTLEGLVVSYFTRPSKTYDTLMQMGRWFGYRDGYLDVTRLYAPEVLLNWFRHISDADRELRSDFENMSAIGATPENFGHRVRTHPLLQITSTVKMRDGSKERCSYSGDLVQTLVFRTKHEDRQHNFKSVERLLAEAENHAQPESDFRKGSILWRSISPTSITLFLESYKIGYENGLRKTNTNLIAKYITAQTAKGNLIFWTVLVSGSKTGDLISIAGKTVGLIKRTDQSKDSTCFKPSIVTQPVDEKVIKLDPDDWQKAFDETKLIEKEKNGAIAAEKITEPRNVQLRKFRSSSEGLLIIYPIKAEETHRRISELPFMGVAVSFPKIGEEQDEPVEYIVNSVAQEEYEY